VKLLSELRERRVVQITLGYLAGCWGLIQVFEFLESRLQLSPHLVNLVSLALVLLLPSVLLVAWRHGRQGPDRWGRVEKVTLPLNVVAAGLLLVILFGGKELGAVTQTIEVRDEHGAVSERDVPKSAFRHRLVVFYPENAGDAEDDWAREVVTLLLVLDLLQDPFLQLQLPMNMTPVLAEAGHPDGHGLPRSLQRRIAREAHFDAFLAGTCARTGDGWRLSLELHDSESGRLISTRVHEGSDLFALVDGASVQARRDLDIPSHHIESSPDVPVAEMTSADLEAVRDCVRGLVLTSHRNDWAGSIAPLEQAVERDPGFALAQFSLYTALQMLGRGEEAKGAISAAMENIYRLPERYQFQTKSAYYYNVKQDADKALAVIQMWSRLYPDDPSAYAQQAFFYTLRDDKRAAIACLEKMLEIDPRQDQILTDIGGLYQDLGEFEEAERHFRRYVDLNPGLTQGYESLADLYRRTGRLADARAAIEQAQLLEPDNPDLAFELARIDLADGRYAECRAACESALAGSENPHVRERIHQLLLSLELTRGRLDAAAARMDAWYGELSAIYSPLQRDVVCGLMLPYILVAGNEQELLDRIDRMQAGLVPPVDTYLEISRAWILAWMGRPDEADSALATVREVIGRLKLDTLEPRLDEVAGLIAEARGDLAAAAGFYRKALAQDGSRLRYRERLGRVLRRQGETDEAREVLERAVLVEPANPQASLELALLWDGRGQHGRAREHLAVALAAWDGADPAYAPAREARELAARLDLSP
jgi:tetratricopeptide (TPR) repeat protein